MEGVQINPSPQGAISSEQQHHQLRKLPCIGRRNYPWFPPNRGAVREKTQRKAVHLVGLPTFAWFGVWASQSLDVGDKVPPQVLKGPIGLGVGILKLTLGIAKLLTRGFLNRTAIANSL